MIIFKCIICERNKKPYLWFHVVRTNNLRQAHRSLFRLFGDNVASFDVV